MGLVEVLPGKSGKSSMIKSHHLDKKSSYDES